MNTAFDRAFNAATTRVVVVAWLDGSAGWHYHRGAVEAQESLRAKGFDVDLTAWRSEYAADVTRNGRVVGTLEPWEGR